MTSKTTNFFVVLHFLLASLIQEIYGSRLERSPVQRKSVNVQKSQNGDTSTTTIQTHTKEASIVNTGSRSDNVTTLVTNFTLQLNVAIEGNFLIIAVAVVAFSCVLACVLVLLMKQLAAYHPNRKKKTSTNRNKRSVLRKPLPIRQKRDVAYENDSTDTDQSSTTTSESDNNYSDNEETRNKKKGISEKSKFGKSKNKVLSKLSEKIDRDTVYKMVRRYLPRDRQNAFLESLKTGIPTPSTAETFQLAYDQINRYNRKWNVDRLTSYFEETGQNSYAECIRPHIGSLDNC